ncbi:MAG: hypothetical protein PWQ77_1679, partial [Kosmotogales bacterium]|nr:hypothetical protein [Kosmotogales bacterium]
LLKRIFKRPIVTYRLAENLENELENQTEGFTCLSL